MKSDKDILDQFDKHYKESSDALLAQYNEYNECVAFYHGDYMNYRDVVESWLPKPKEVSFNRVQPYVDSMVGFLIQNRRDMMFHSRNSDERLRKSRTDYINGLKSFIRENANANQVETQQDIDFVIGGIGITDTAITSRTDEPTTEAGGEILVERVSPLEAGWDCRATKTNLTDAKYCWRSKDFPEEEVLEMFDIDVEELEFVQDEPKSYTFNPCGGINSKIGFGYANYDKNLVRVYYYHWYEIENYYRVENPAYMTDDAQLQQSVFQLLSTIEQDKSEESFVFKPEDKILTITKDIKKKVKELFQDHGLDYEPVTFKRKIYYTAIVSGSRVLGKFKCASQQGFSMKFKTGRYNPRTGIFTGMVSSMKDPQKYYNRALTEFMLIIASSPKGGVIAQNGAIDDIQKFEQSYSKYNSVSFVNDLGLVRDKTVQQGNTGYEAVMQISGDSFEKVTGINESVFGVAASGNETALLQRQRIKQATTIMAIYVDSVDLYAKEQSQLLLSFIRLLAETSEGKLFDTYDDDGNLINERISAEFLEKDYGMVLQEAPEGDAQRDYLANILIQLGSGMQAIGDVQRANMIYAEAVKLLPIPEKEKTKITEILVGEQPINPQIVKQMQKQIQMLTSEQAKIASAKQMSEIAKNKANIQKIVADIQSQKLADREAVEDIEQKALANDIMAMKPINDVTVTI